MTDFNKGDFTQQGVDGHVNAKIRLNAKRYLDIDLTSDEDASGCTIAGHVYDSLNDITYPIGSAPSGNIEITENTAEGEPLDISQYATATVNVAGGGAEIRKCTVSIQNTSANTGTIMVFSLNEQNGCFDYSVLTVPGNESTTADFLVEYDLDNQAYGPYHFWRSFIGLEETIPTITNLNNITVDEHLNPTLTDPTIDASFTVRVGFQRNV